MIDDIVLNKKERIERCILQIKKYYALNQECLFEEDFFKQDAIGINLQRLCELTIDLANHIVKKYKLGIYSDNFNEKKLKKFVNTKFNLKRSKIKSNKDFFRFLDEIIEKVT